MWTFVVIIAFLGIIYFVVKAVISLFKRNGTSKRRFLYAAASFIIFIIGCVKEAQTNPQQVKEVAKAPQEQAITSAATPAPVVQDQSSPAAKPAPSVKPDSATTPAPSKTGKPSNKTTSELKPGPDKVASAGGLGDTLKVINSSFGDPTRINQQMNQGVGMYHYQNDNISVDYYNERAMHVTYNLDSHPLSLGEAKILAKKMMPADATFVKKYTKDYQQFYVYKSSTLSKLFDQDMFSNTNGDIQPGYFDIAYLMDMDDNTKIRAVDSFISDNP